MKQPSSRTLSQLLTANAERHSDRNFLIFERQIGAKGGPPYEESWTYSRFDRQVNQVCRYLVDLGVQKGDVINLHLPNCPEFLLLWFAIARIGAVMMPTNILASVPEMAYLIEHSGAKVSFSVTSCAQLLTPYARDSSSLQQVVYCNEKSATFSETIQHFSGDSFASPAGPRDLMAIMYTSGTTSKPKGVMVTHANYVQAGATVADAISLTKEDRHFVVLPLFHGNAQYYSVMSAMVRGASVALMDRFSASRYFDRCRYHQCTVASLFAAPMRMILAQPENTADLDNNLRAVIFAQSLSDRQLLEWERRFAAPLGQLWGMTETMGPPLMNPWNGERRNQTIGKPIGGYNVRLLDEQGQTAAAGQQGEIAVEGVPGETIMLGYFNNPQATEETIRNGWLYTGDNAIVDSRGYFVFVDRIKDMIKRSGENVSAGEVEAVLQQHPAVFESAVIGLPDEVRDEKIIGVVVLKESETLSAADLTTFCAEHLAPFRVPEEILFERELPKTSVGKIQKNLIRSALIEARSR